MRFLKNDLIYLPEVIINCVVKIYIICMSLLVKILVQSFMRTILVFCKFSLINFMKNYEKLDSFLRNNNLNDVNDFFFLSEYSFTNIHNSHDSRGRRAFIIIIGGSAIAIYEFGKLCRDNLNWKLFFKNVFGVSKRLFLFF